MWFIAATLRTSYVFKQFSEQAHYQLKLRYIDFRDTFNIYPFSSQMYPIIFFYPVYCRTILRIIQVDNCLSHQLPIHKQIQLTLISIECDERNK